MSFVILAVGPWYAANAFRYLIDAFEKIDGCEVFRVGPSYNDHAGINWGTDVVTPDVPLSLARPWWKLPYFTELCTRSVGPPDLLIVSEETYQTKIFPEIRLPTVLISYDGWPNSFARRELFQPTVAYTNHPYGIRAHPRTEEAPGWKYLPGAAAPWIHKDLGLERDRDFALFATPYGQRPVICQALVDRGLSVRSGLVATEQYVKEYNRALCTLHNCNAQEEVKFRWFEAAAMGCVNISDHTRLFNRLGYRPWVHYVPVANNSADDDPWPMMEAVYNQVQWLKSHPETALALARASRHQTLSSHTYFHRCQKIFSDVGFPEMADQVQAFITRQPWYQPELP